MAGKDNIGPNRLAVGAHYGLKDWLAQRVTAIVMAIYTLLSMSEYLPWNRGRPSGRRTGIKLLDTNVIIDGRIYDVVRSGFLDGQIYVPGFVLDELPSRISTPLIKPRE